MFFNEGVLKNFLVTCVGVSFSIKLLKFRPANLLKRGSNIKCFPENIAKYLTTAFL